MRFKPWLHHPGHAWADEEENDSTFVSHWNQFLQTEAAQTLVPNWSREIDAISYYIESNSSDEDAEAHTIADEQEEWMLLNIELNSFPQYWQEHKQYYTDKQISNMPSWIQQQKESFIISMTTNKEIDVSTFNEAQSVSYKIVFGHFIQEDANPLLLIITELAGSGKGYVIDAMKSSS